MRTPGVGPKPQSPCLPIFAAPGGKLSQAPLHPGSSAIAENHFRQGVALSDNRNYASAVKAFRAAIPHIESPDVLMNTWINMGICLEELFGNIFAMRAVFISVLSAPYLGVGLWRLGEHYADVLDNLPKANDLLLMATYLNPDLRDRWWGRQPMRPYMSFPGSSSLSFPHTISFEDFFPGVGLEINDNGNNVATPRRHDLILHLQGEREKRSIILEETNTTPQSTLNLTDSLLSSLDPYVEDEASPCRIKGLCYNADALRIENWLREFEDCWQRIVAAPLKENSVVPLEDKLKKELEVLNYNASYHRNTPPVLIRFYQSYQEQKTPIVVQRTEYYFPKRREWTTEVILLVKNPGDAADLSRKDFFRFLFMALFPARGETINDGRRTRHPQRSSLVDKKELFDWFYGQT